MAASLVLIAVALPVAGSPGAPGAALAATLGIRTHVVVLLPTDGSWSATGSRSSGIGPGWSATADGLDADSVLLSVLDGDGPPPAVRLRSHGPSGWSDWIEVHASRDEAPDLGTEGALAGDLLGPVWTGASTDRVQVILEEGRGSALRVEALRTANAEPAVVAAAAAVPALTATGDTTSRGPTAPQILPTSAWGSPGWSYGTSGCEEGPKVAPLQLALVHHTVSTNTYTAAEADDLIRGIYYAHLQRGWCDIAYNFIVDRFGRIWQGRSGPANAAVIGGHAAGFNTGSVGIALLGQHQPGADPPAVAPTSAELDAIATVIGWKFTLHGLDPLSSTDYTVRNGNTRFPPGTVVHLARVSGHRDTGSTSCPGDYTYERLPDIRTRAAERRLTPKVFSYGTSSDEVLWGDWNGDGRADPAVRRGNSYLMRFSASGGSAELTESFGRTTDQAIVGDWDADGTDTIGVYRDGLVYLTSENKAQGEATSSFRYGREGDFALSGDWNGDGTDGIGVRRGNKWLLRQTASGGSAQSSFSFGRATDVAFTGDWDGDGQDTAAVWRDGVAYLGAQNSSAPFVAQQQVAGSGSRLLAGDPTGRGFDMVGRADANRWTSWLLMPWVP